MFRFVKKLKPYFTEHKNPIMCFCIVIIISIVFEVLKIFLTVDLMDFDVKTPTTRMVTVICGITIFTVLMSLCKFIGQMILDFVMLDVFEKVREDLYKHIRRLKVDFVKTGIEGDFLTRWAIDLQTTQNVFVTKITALMVAPIAIVVYGTYLIIKRWDLFLVSFLPVFIALFTADRYGKYLSKKANETTKEQTKLNDIIKDSVICMPILKIYMLLESMCDKFSKVSEKIYKIQKDVTKVWTINISMSNLLWFDMGNVLCCAYGAYLCYMGEMNLASFFIFKFIFSTLKLYIEKLVDIISDFRYITFHVNRVFDIFDYEIEEIDNNKLSEGEYEMDIEFKAVSFAYNDKNILKDCSFKIRKGERVALVGENCKTTILNLMCGFYMPNNGNISVCGQSINQTNLKYIRDKISIVLQEPKVFLGTIKQNIICNYKYNKDKFEDVTQISLVNNFVRKFSNEYNTFITGQACVLSGGQCQRLNLARALYKDSKILLLDNYTSALDNDTKRLIYKNMNRLKDRTIVIFSNELHDLEQVDRVILIKDGQVYKQGRHKDILDECSYYRRILNQE